MLNEHDIMQLLEPQVIKMGALAENHYKIECVGPDGKVKWVEEFDNLVTTAGLNKYLDATIKTGSAAPTWYVFLVKAKTTGYDAADTLASHGGWTEAIPGTDYTGNRIAFVPGTIAAGSVDNVGSVAVFPCLTSITILGAGLANVATGTSGTLLGAGDFSPSRSVGAGDTLNVTVTVSIASA